MDSPLFFMYSYSKKMLKIEERFILATSRNNDKIKTDKGRRNISGTITTYSSISWRIYK